MYKMWRCTQSMLVHENPWFRVRRDEVVSNDESLTAIYYLVERPPSVAIVALSTNGDVALVRQWRYARQALRLEVPTGIVELTHNETPVEAAARELAEETGLRAKSWQSLGSIEYGGSTETGHIFLAQDVDPGPATPDATEGIEFLWMPFECALERLDAGEICGWLSVSSLLRASRILRR